jgi:hypothetical protein
LYISDANVSQSTRLNVVFGSSSFLLKSYICCKVCCAAVKCSDDVYQYSVLNKPTASLPLKVISVAAVEILADVLTRVDAMHY